MDTARAAAALPELPPPPAKEMRGPTEWSNWVIPGRVLAGAFPASQSDADTDATLSRLLFGCGVTVFVCLQAEVSLHVPEHAWRAGRALRPYPRDAQRLLSAHVAAHAAAATQQQQEQQEQQQKQHQPPKPARLDFLHLPIVDGGVTADGALRRLADDCCARVLAGERLYIHCWGGHGRTGTLVAVMLGRLYGLPAAAALRLTQAYHDARVHPQGVRSPQTPVQRAQVRRLLAAPAVAPAAPLAAAVPRSLLAAAAADEDGGSGAEAAVAQSSKALRRPEKQQQQQQQQQQQPCPCVTPAAAAASAPPAGGLRAPRSLSPPPAKGAAAPPSPYAAASRPRSSTSASIGTISTSSASTRRSTISAATRSRSASPTVRGGGVRGMARAASASAAVAVQSTALPRPLGVGDGGKTRRSHL